MYADTKEVICMAHTLEMKHQRFSQVRPQTINQTSLVIVERSKDPQGLILAAKSMGVAESFLGAQDTTHLLQQLEAFQLHTLDILIR